MIKLGTKEVLIMKASRSILGKGFLETDESCKLHNGQRNPYLYREFLQCAEIVRGTY